MNVIERSLFLILVMMAVWSLQYATFTAAIPLAFEGSGNNNMAEMVFPMILISLKETLSSPQNNIKSTTMMAIRMIVINLNM